MNKRVIVYDADPGQNSCLNTREDEVRQLRSIANILSDRDKFPDFDRMSKTEDVSARLLSYSSACFLTVPYHLENLNRLLLAQY